MDRANLENYQSSLSIVKAMLVQCVISDKEYKIAEAVLAKKYCIKKDSLYRQNDLIFSSKRVMYSTSKVEVKNGENSNKNRSVTKIKQKD